MLGAELGRFGAGYAIRRTLGAAEELAPLHADVYHSLPSVLSAGFGPVGPLHPVGRLLRAVRLTALLAAEVDHPRLGVLLAEFSLTVAVAPHPVTCHFVAAVVGALVPADVHHSVPGVSDAERRLLGSRRRIRRGFSAAFLCALPAEDIHHSRRGVMGAEHRLVGAHLSVRRPSGATMKSRYPWGAAASWPSRWVGASGVADVHHSLLGVFDAELGLLCPGDAKRRALGALNMRTSARHTFSSVLVGFLGTNNIQMRKKWRGREKGIERERSVWGGEFRKEPRVVPSEIECADDHHGMREFVLKLRPSQVLYQHHTLVRRNCCNVVIPIILRTKYFVFRI